MLRIIKDLFHSIFRRKELTRTIPKRKKFKGICNYCKNDIKKPIINSFYCKYCKKWHCEKHRLPEDHECKNPRRPKDLIQPTPESLKHI